MHYICENSLAVFNPIEILPKLIELINLIDIGLKKMEKEEVCTYQKALVEHC
jgi:hypothetical protein